MKNLGYIGYITDHIASPDFQEDGLPVCRESHECEDGHPHRSELNESNKFTSDSTKQPFWWQVPASIHGNTGEQEQQVSKSQVGNKEVGDISHRLNCAEDFDQRDIANQAYQNDDAINSWDGIQESVVE